jgi:hypothetical protein
VVDEALSDMLRQMILLVELHGKALLLEVARPRRSIEFIFVLVYVRCG